MIEGIFLVYGFQSTLPSQGATILAVSYEALLPISIHAPLTGSDVRQNKRLCNPLISIHAPLTGSDHSAGKYSFCTF